MRLPCAVAIAVAIVADASGAAGVVYEGSAIVRVESAVGV